jgi:hypothetical protein
MTAYDQPLLPTGTPVKITGGGLWIGSTGTIAKAYRIRHGHPMYDVELAGGSVSTYHGAAQLEVIPVREIITHHRVQNTRTPNQVQDAVRSLNRKFSRVNRHGVSRVEATLEDGAIAVRYLEADRTMTDQPDTVHAEGFLDVNMSAVWLYREAQAIYRDGLHNEIQAYLKANPLTR